MTKTHIHTIVLTPLVGHDLGDRKNGLDVINALTLTGIPSPVCQPVVTYTKKELTPIVNATSDAMIDVILWSVNPTDTDFQTKKWERHSVEPMTPASLISNAAVYSERGNRGFYLDLKYQDPDCNEYTETARMYVAANDEVIC